MPGVTVDRDQLFERIGESFTDDNFATLCFEFGIELDEVVNDEGNNTTQYKIDIPANRYDLLCIEGLSLALGIFLKKRTTPIYKVVDSGKKIATKVNPSTTPLRPYIVTAVLRNVNLSKQAYESIINLQEKLHHNICRKRALVAIGIHDLDTLQPPFTYTTELPQSIKFVPLNQTRSFAADELLEFYKSDTHLKPYLHLINTEPRYPVIRDSNGVVLSLPPIINGDHSKVSLKTTNLFIECTATDHTKANIVLDTLLTMLTEYCSKPYEFEGTEVVYEKSTEMLPALKYKRKSLHVPTVCSRVGIKWTGNEIVKGLTKMGLEATSGKDEDWIEVNVPPTRHDIIHTDDIIEDVAIAYGYSNIEPLLPPTVTLGNQFPLNKLTSGLREGIAQSGFTEVLTFSLLSLENECENLRIPLEQKEDILVQIKNPKTQDFQVVRSTLLPGLLKTVGANRKMPLPLKIFEVSDVVVLDAESNDVGARNKRNLCALYCNKISGFEIIHGLLDRIMQLLEIPADDHDGYRLAAVDDPTFFSGRCAEILYRDVTVGKMGVIHPEVMKNFGLYLPASALEICIENLL